MTSSPESEDAEENGEELAAVAADSPRNLPPPPEIVLQETTDDDSLRRNMVALIAHQVCFRIAWIFKTESVILPAFVDMIAGNPAVTGLLPTLNRLGQSLAPLMVAEKLRAARRKRFWLTNTTVLMSLPFLVVSGLLFAFDGKPEASWFVPLFMLLYATFFCLHGVQQIAVNTLQGKIIPADKRGRLLGISVAIGSPAAVICAWVFLRRWLRDSPNPFALIFGITGLMFLTASFFSRAVRETADRRAPHVPFRSLLASIRRAYDRAMHDANLRRLCIVAMLLVSSQLLFPHYQRLGRERSGYESQMLMWWVIVQNLGAGLFGAIFGRIADAHGTRLALRIVMSIAAVSPVVALLAARLLPPAWFWITFAILGAVPTSYRMLMNYTLEITRREHHPEYIATVTLSMAIPILLSAPVGALIRWVGYLPVFAVITALVMCGAAMTFRMVEPRNPPAC